MLQSCFLASLSLFHFVTTPVVNMRENPSDSAGIVSQAYYSEEVRLIEEGSDWIKIETVVDHYQGWIKAEGVCHRKDRFPSDSFKVAKINRCMAHLYQVPDTIYGPLATLPFESQLEIVDEQDVRWIKVRLADQREGYIQRGDVKLNTDLISQNLLPSFSLQFQGLPYTWGGRSSFGYDCSGFVQMLYRQMGIFLPRDSKDQAKWEGFKAITLDELSPGDLIFFGIDEARIRHVGMYLGDDQFIHATVSENAPYIHISHLSDPEWNGSGKWGYITARTLVSIEELSNHFQLIVVTTSGWEEKGGVLHRFERASGKEHWTHVGNPMSVVLGAEGMASGIGLYPVTDSGSKVEGDLKSPAGMFSLGCVFGFLSTAEMSHLKMDYLQLNEFTEAVDDPLSLFYNQIVDRRDVAVDWESSEKMREEPLYAMGAVINHNWPSPVPGKGSAIFLHSWSQIDKGTAGCTALSPDDLEEVLLWLEKNKNPLWVQLPYSVYSQLQTNWNLPDL